MGFEDVDSVLSENSNTEKNKDGVKKAGSKLTKKLDEEIDLKELYDKTLSKAIGFLNFRFAYELLMVPIIWLTWYIRTRDLGNLSGKYLIGLDPYYYLRHARTILETGSLPSIDLMRTFPFGNKIGFNLFPYFLAYWNKFLNLFGDFTLEYTSIIYNPVITAISIIFLYLFLKNTFSKKVGVLGSLILVVSPAYLFRTIAGFSDHEALFMFFMFLALWLFSEIKIRKKYYSKLLFACGSGFTTFLAAVTWVASPMITIPIGAYILMEIFWSNKKTKYFLAYLSWFGFFLIPLILIKGASGFRELGLIMPAFAIASFGVYLFLEHRNVKLKVKNGIIAIGSVGIVGGILAQLTNIINIAALWSILLTPAEGSGRVADTISEIISGTAVFNMFGWFAVLALVGAALAAFFGFEESNKKPKFFLAAITFVVGGPILFGGLSVHLSVLLLLAFGGALISTYAFSKSFSKGKNHLAIIPLTLFLFSGYLTGTGARFLFTFAPAVAMLSAYAAFQAIDLPPEKFRKVIAVAVILVIGVLVYQDLNATVNEARHTFSGLPGQWEEAFNWMRENTSEGAGVAHWWDYGYWTQAIGERPSIADGGTHGEYMLYLLGRYGMTGQTTEEALTYFNTHNISYLLYSDEEIGKYWAFSHIGSNKSMDRESTIGTFGLSNIKEVRDGNLLIYNGGWPFDRDLVIDKKIFPKGRTQVHTVKIMEDGSSGTATFTDGTDTIEDPIKCLVVNGQKVIYDVESKLGGGCFVAIPSFDEQGVGDPTAALLYLSEKSKDSIFTRLYIQNEKIEGFEEVYNDGVPLGIFKGKLVGPIRIWKINYPSSIGTNPLWRSISTEREEGFR